MDLTGLVADAMAASGDAAARSWAACGAMALTGRAGGPADAAPARAALAVDALAGRFEELAARHGRPVSVPGAALLGERAAAAALTRRGDVSCGGGTRLLPAADSWLAVALTRAVDVEMLPAWLEAERVSPIAAPPSVPVAADVWTAVGHEVAKHRATDLVARAALLGMAVAAVAETGADDDIVHVDTAGDSPPGDLGDLTVVDLSSLWAGPLCAQLLGLAGARVIKVESANRPDGARAGPPAFFELLHAGHDAVALDLPTDAACRQLTALLRQADVVVEASRPRALQQLGVGPQIVLDRPRPGVWVSITGHGRDDDSAMRVAFGDDAAVAGGLVAGTDDHPLFCSDAVADPASGLVAAVAVLEMVDAGIGGVVDVALSRTAAHVAAGIRDNPPIGAAADALVAEPPRSRDPAGRAPALGEHTDAVLAGLGAV